MKIEPFKIKVTPEQSKIVQEVLQNNNVNWNIQSNHNATLMALHYLYVDNSIKVGSSRIGWDNCSLPELTFPQFQELYCQIPKPTGKVENPDYFEEYTKAIEKQIANMQINGSTRDIPFYAESNPVFQQEIDSRLHEYGYNIPQQELVPRPDDRLNKIIERLDKIIELLSSNKTLLDAKQMLTDCLSKHH